MSGPKVIAVASMQRNEARYILEWFSYYLVQGVNKFVIYNHMSTDETQSIYERLKELGYDIDIHYRDGYNVHYPMLEHALTNYVPVVDWLIFADMDEFYFPTKHANIAAVLADYEDMPSSALGVYWCAYGSSGHIVDPEFVTRDFNYRGPFNLSTNHHMKSIIRGRGLAGSVAGTNPHVFTTEKGTQDMLGRIIPSWAGHNAQGPITHEIMRINHYQCKSWDYFKSIKQARGTTADRPPGAPGSEIPDEVFKEYDHNDIMDNTLWDRFGEQIQTQYNELKEKLI